MENTESVSRFANSFDKSRTSQDKIAEATKTDKSGKELQSPRHSQDARSPRMPRYGGDMNALRRSLSARSRENSFKLSSKLDSVEEKGKESHLVSVAHDSEDVHTGSDTPRDVAVSAELVMGGIQYQEAVILDVSEVDTAPVATVNGTTLDAVGEINQLNATVLAIATSMRDTPTSSMRDTPNSRVLGERSPEIQPVAKHLSNPSLKDRLSHSADGSFECGSNDNYYDC